MAGAGDYLRNQRVYSDVSGQAVVAAADSATVTLVTAKTGWTVYVQRVYVTIITDAAQFLTFKDSNGTPVQVEITDASPGAGTEYIWDFGPRGKQLTEAKNFVMSISGAGLAAHVEFDAYMKQTGREVVPSMTNAEAVYTGQNFK